VRVLRIELGALARGARPVLADAAALGHPWSVLAGWGGSGLGLACLHAEAVRTPGGPQPLVLAAGAACSSDLIL
jgi:hypothetical protein